MAGVISVATERAQIAAIARVRWRLFVNSLRTMRGRLQLVSRIFMALGFAWIGLGGMFGVGILAWSAAKSLERAGAASADLRQVFLLAAPFWIVLLFWQIFPLLTSTFAEIYDLSNLLRFPLPYRSYFLVRLAYGSLDPGTAISCLWLIGIFVGIALGAPALAVWAALACLVFGAMNLLLARAIFAWIEHWLARRRTREIFGFLFLLLIIGSQFIAPLLGRYGHKKHPGMGYVLAAVLPYERVLPPGLAAGSLLYGRAAHWAPALGVLAALAGYAALFGWLLHVRVKRQFEGENLGETKAPGRAAARARGSAVRAAWNVPGLSPPVAAVFEKELRYFLRSGPMLFTFAMPFVILLLFRVQPGSPRRNAAFHGSIPSLAFPLVSAYAMLILTNIVGNNLGSDAAGVQFFFAAPARFRQVLLGKNLAHAAIVAFEIALVWIAAAWIYEPPSLSITLATLAGLLFAVPVDFAIGNLLSLYSPKKIDFAMFGRQKPPGTTQLASLGVQFVVVGVATIAFLIGHFTGHMWIATVILLLLAAGAIAAYATLLNRAEAFALEHRETLIAELCKA